MTQLRFVALDGLRGIACLSVIIFHFFSAFVPQLISEQSSKSHWISDTPIGVFYNGGFAVSIFFVLSGFVVSNSIRSDGSISVLVTSLCRRYLRLAIPSACSAVFAVSMLMLMPDIPAQLQSLSPHAWLTYVVTPPFPSFFEAIFEGGVGVFVTGNSLINNVLWTMKIELFGSIAVILICSVTSGVVRAVALSVMAAGLAVLGKPEYSAFMLGALLCSTRRRYLDNGSLGWVVVVFAVVIGAWTKGFGDRIGIQLPSVIALGEPHKVWHSVAAIALVYAALTYSPLMKALSTSFPVFLGRISFGLYLLHVPLIYTVVGYFFLIFDPSNFLELLAALLIFLASCGIAAFVFTTVIDEPVVRKLRNIQRWSVKLLSGSAREKAIL